MFCRAPDETGKTAARDILLDRPNIAAAIGVVRRRGAADPVHRLGDRPSAACLREGRNWSFLASLRSELQGELARVTENACEMSTRERS